MAFGSLISLGFWLKAPAARGVMRESKYPNLFRDIRPTDSQPFPAFAETDPARKQRWMAQLALISLVNSHKAPAAPSGETAITHRSDEKKHANDSNESEKRIRVYESEFETNQSLRIRV
jgi:hypothetical protein